MSEGRNQFDTHTSGQRSFINGTLLESINGGCVGKVTGFGFMGHRLLIVDAGDKSPHYVGKQVWTGQNWRLNWKVRN